MTTLDSTSATNAPRLCPRADRSSACPPIESDVALPVALPSWEREVLAPILGASMGEVNHVDR